MGNDGQAGLDLALLLQAFADESGRLLLLEAVPDRLEQRLMLELGTHRVGLGSAGAGGVLRGARLVAVIRRRVARQLTADRPGRAFELSADLAWAVAVTVNMRDHAAFLNGNKMLVRQSGVPWGAEVVCNLNLTRTHHFVFSRHGALRFELDSARWPTIMIRTITHLSFIRFGIRDRIARAFHNPDMAAPKAFEVDFFGKRYLGDFSTFIDWSVYYYGAYSIGELLLVRDQLADCSDPVVFDVGANIGHHSLFYSTIASHVHAFEPYGEVSKKLTEKIIVNGLENVTLHPFGLGETNETLAFDVPTTTNTGTGKFVSGQSTDQEESEQLEVRRGDDIVSTLDLPRLDFVKIDVEGFETNCMAGLKNTLTEYRPIVFVEWNQPNTTLPDLAKYFPPNYEFHHFHAYVPKMGVFCRAFYELQPLIGNKPLCEGNYLASPVA